MFFTKDAGFEYVRNLLGSYGFRIESVHPYNFGQHRLVKTDKQIFYVLYKRSPIHSFNNFRETQAYLRENPDMQGWGESINVDFAMLAKRNNAVLLYVYENEDVYIIPASKVVDECSRFSLIRSQEKLNSHTKTDDVEREYIFPMKWLQRYN